MSIDFLFDLEREIDSGKDVFATEGLGRNQWVIGRSVDELRKLAKKTAENKRLAVSIVKLVLKSDALPGNNYLVPVKIGQPGSRGEPQIEWKVMESKDAAETFRDLRFGPAPFFSMQIEETFSPPG